MNQAALVEKYLFLQRKAVDALIDLYQNLGFNDSDLAINVKVLGELCQHREASVLGNALVSAEHAKKGNWEALDVMERQIALGMSAHKSADNPSLRLGGLMHLPPILDAIQGAALSIPLSVLPINKNCVKSVALIVSNLSQGAATTLVARKFIKSLNDLGLDTYLLITGHDSLPNDDSIELEIAGVKIFNIEQQTVYARAQNLVQQALDLQLDAIIFYTWPTDIAAQIASCKRMSLRQMFINHTCDQRLGAFDIRVSYTRDTAGLTDPQRCYYVPPVRVREEKIEDVAHVSLSLWDIDEATTIIGNYSRLSKCVDKAFMEAMVKILHRNPSVILMLPGLSDPDSEGILRAWFESNGLQKQVKFPGFLLETYLPLLKVTRVYCDTFIWTGGQSVLDAMAMGVPVVSSKAALGGTALDPTGVSPATLGSELLPDSALVAESNSVDGYVAIVQRLLDDSEFHHFHKQQNIARAEELSWHQYPRIVVELLNQLHVK